MYQGGQGIESWDSQGFPSIAAMNNHPHRGLLGHEIHWLYFVLISFKTSLIIAKNEHHMQHKSSQ